MREIKFRSWANGAMWHVNGLACTDESEKMDLVDDSIGGYDSVYDYDEVETRVLMQYIGLQDRNGREIYEGDIVKGTTLDGYDYEGAVVFYTQNNVFGWNVEAANGGAWRIEQLATKISLDHITGEIIGNIFENHWEAE